MLAGLMIYVLFRENTYVARFAESIISFDFLREKVSFLENPFLKFYLPDYLWALSFNGWLHIILKPREKGSFVCSAAVAVFGAGFEILQYFGIIKGTADIIDILLYVLAVATIKIIYTTKGKREK